jgi:hypothetical protein
MRQTLVTDFEFWDPASGLDASLWLALIRTTNSVPLPVSELSGSSEMISEDRGATIPAIRSNVSGKTLAPKTAAKSAR